MTELETAKAALANAMMNQVGVEWDEVCNSVDVFCRRHSNESGDLVTALYSECYRYEDM